MVALTFGQRNEFTKRSLVIRQRYEGFDGSVCNDDVLFLLYTVWRSLRMTRIESIETIHFTFGVFFDLTEKYSVGCLQE